MTIFVKKGGDRTSTTRLFAHVQPVAGVLMLVTSRRLAHSQCYYHRRPLGYRTTPPDHRPLVAEPSIR